MSTAQQAASHTNGAQSRGPVTDRGKAKSAANSLKHGLCAKDLVLTDPAEIQRFEASVAELAFAYRAVTDIQKRACRHLAKIYWRRDVLDNLEMLFWQAVERGEICAAEGGSGFPGLSSINRYRARIARDLQLARAEMDELFERRADAFKAEMTKAKEMSDKTMLGGLIQHMGLDAFQSFRTNVASPGKTNPTQAQDVENKAEIDPERAKKLAKNKAQKQARKVTNKNRK